MAKYLLGAFSDEYSSEIVEQVKALNEYGIGYMEVRGVNGKNVSVLDKREVKELKNVLDGSGIKASSIGSPLGKINIESDLNAHFELANRVFETANELGAKRVRMFSFYVPNKKEEYKGKVLFSLEQLAKLSEKHGVILCHENEADIYGESPEKCLEILEYFGGKIKCVFDMGNFVLDGYEPFSAYQMLKAHIEYFHIKDSLSAGAIVPAGKGEAKIKEILKDYSSAMQKDTFITLEPHLQTFSGFNALTNKSFDNPFKYENQKCAFTDAVNNFNKILGEIL